MMRVIFRRSKFVIRFTNSVCLMSWKYRINEVKFMFFEFPPPPPLFCLNLLNFYVLSNRTRFNKFHNDPTYGDKKKKKNLWIIQIASAINNLAIRCRFEYHDIRKRQTQTEDVE